jgi:hypothetical protein
VVARGERHDAAGALVEADNAQKELTARGETGYVFRNWLVRGNKFCHGTRPSVVTVNMQNVVFESNDLGRADNPWPGASYAGNTSQASGCLG